MFLLVYHQLPKSHNTPTMKSDADPLWSDIMNIEAKLQLASATSRVSKRPFLRTVRRAMPAVSFNSAMVTVAADGVGSDRLVGHFHKDLLQSLVDILRNPVLCIAIAIHARAQGTEHEKAKHDIWKSLHDLQYKKRELCCRYYSKEVTSTVGLPALTSSSAKEMVMTRSS